MDLCFAINKTRNEFITPHSFGESAQASRCLRHGSLFLTAFATLMTDYPSTKGGSTKPFGVEGRWAGDRVLLCGDHYGTEQMVTDAFESGLDVSMQVVRAMARTDTRERLLEQLNEWMFRPDLCLVSDQQRRAYMAVLEPSAQIKRGLQWVVFPKRAYSRAGKWEDELPTRLLDAERITDPSRDDGNIYFRPKFLVRPYKDSGELLLVTTDDWVVDGPFETMADAMEVADAQA